MLETVNPPYRGTLNVAQNSQGKDNDLMGYCDYPGSAGESESSRSGATCENHDMMYFYW